MKFMSLFILLLMPLLGSEEVKDFWGSYDARLAPLNIEVVETLESDKGTLKLIRYSLGELKGSNQSANPQIAAFIGIPKGASKETPVAGIVHIHGGGQRAEMRRVQNWMDLGFACISINWGQKPIASTKGAPNTDWDGLAAGFIEPKHHNTIKGGVNTLYKEDHLLNSSWNLIAMSARRALTVLEEFDEVDASRLGVEGHSMGGRSTVLTAIDPRIKAAAPSVGGTGFLYRDMWGLEGSARRMKADENLAFYQKVVSAQSYWPSIQAPVLFLQGSNDFNAPMDLVEEGMALLPETTENIMSIAPHFNHRFTDEAAAARIMWMDAHLNSGLIFPRQSPAEFVLEKGAVPLFKMKLDQSTQLAVEKVEIYYGTTRDSRIRFWNSGKVSEKEGVYSAPCPIFDLNEPLFAFANITYTLPKKVPIRLNGPTTESMLLSSEYKMLYPDALKAAGVKATAKRTALIDDFGRGWQDWYLLNFNNPHHWYCATRKVCDPVYMGAEGAELAVELETSGDENSLEVGVEVNTWQGYTGRKRGEFFAVVELDKAGPHSLSLKAEDFSNKEGEKLSNWDELTQLSFSPVKKAKSSNKKWNGKAPVLKKLEWVGGDINVKRPYPYLTVNALNQQGGSFDKEFQDSIKDSIKLEKQDAATSEKQ